MAKSDGEDFLGLGIAYDEAVFARLQVELDKIENKNKSINDVLMQMVAAEQKVTDAATKTGRVLSETLDVGETKLTEVTKKVEGLSAQLGVATEKASSLSKHLKPDFLPEQGYISGLSPNAPRPSMLPEQSYINQLTKFYGEGKYVPPQADMSSWEFNSDIDPPPRMPVASGSRKAGPSARGLSYGLMSMGFTMQAPGMLAASSILSMEEGLRSSIPLFDMLDQKVRANAGGLSPLIERMTGLGIPMAGLLTVAIPATAAIAGIVIGIKALHDVAEAEGKRLSAQMDAQVKYNQATATMTTEQARSEIDKQKQSKGVLSKNIDDTYNLIEQKVKTDFPILAAKLGPNLRQAVETGARDIKDRPEFSNLYADVDKFKAGIEEIDKSFTLFTDGIKNGAFAVNDLIAKEKLLADQRRNKFQQELNDEIEVSRLIAEGDKKGVKEKIDSTQRELAITEQWLERNAERVAGDEALGVTYDAVVKHVDELRNRLAVLQIAFDGIKPDLLGEFLNRAKEGLEGISSALDKFNEGKIAAAEQLADQTDNATIRELQAEQEYTEGSIQDLYARNQIALKTSRDQAKIEQETADRITDIRTKLSQKEQQLTTDLQRQIFDDRIKFNNDWAKLDRNYQNQVQEDQIKHLEKLDDLNKQTANNQQQALLDRNFLQLAKDAQSKQQQVDQENTHYARQEAARQRHLQQQQVELTVAFTQEQQHRQILNERKRADAQLQANQEITQQQTFEIRKISVLRQFEQQQISDLIATQGYKLQILRQGLANEIYMYQLQETQRLAILERQRNQATAEAIGNVVQTGAGMIKSALQQSGLGQVLGKSLRLFDTGGSFGPGDPFIMSENRPENLNFGSGGYRIPGAALVFPLQSGNVEPRSSKTTHATYAPNINVYESRDPEGTARMIDARNVQLMKDFFGS